VSGPFSSFSRQLIGRCIARCITAGGNGPELGPEFCNLNLIFSLAFLFFSFLFFFFCTIDTVNSPLFRFPDENNQSGSGNSSNIYKLVNLYIKDVTGFLSAAG